MITLTPYKNFKLTSICLSPEHKVASLKAGRSVLTGGWNNKPVTRMWRNHRYQLCQYMLYLDPDDEFVQDQSRMCMVNPEPIWYDWPEFFDAHKSYLLGTDPDWYGQFDWTVEPTKELVWPL